MASPGPVTLEDLRNAEAARLRALEAAEDRNALVRRAIAEGWTHRQVAEAIGCSRGRVGQILHQEDAA